LIDWHYLIQNTGYNNYKLR